jgi:hypothetical protein
MRYLVLSVKLYRGEVDVSNRGKNLKDYFVYKFKCICYKLTGV